MMKINSLFLKIIFKLKKYINLINTEINNKLFSLLRKFNILIIKRIKNDKKNCNINLYIPWERY